MPPLAVVIPTCNDPHRLRLVLEGFNRQIDKDFNLTVVSDDGNFNAEMSVFNEFGTMPGWRYVHHPGKTVPFRAGACRNVGMQYAVGDRVLFMDSDTVPRPNVVQCHKAYGAQKVVVLGRVWQIAEADVPNLGLPDVQREFPGLQVRDDRRLELEGAPYRTMRDRLNGGHIYLATPPSSYRLCWSHHMSVPLELTRSIGGFWEEFTTHGGEDQELGLRLHVADCSIMVDFTIGAWHLDHPRREDPQNNSHQQMIARSSKMPTLMRNGGPIRPFV